MTPITTTRMMRMIITMLQDEMMSGIIQCQCQTRQYRSHCQLTPFRFNQMKMWQNVNNTARIEIHQIWLNPISHSFPQPGWLLVSDRQQVRGKYTTRLLACHGRGGLCQSVESGLAKCCCWYETSSLTQTLLCIQGSKQIGPRQIGPRQIGPWQIGPQANWAPANSGAASWALENWAPGILGPWWLCLANHWFKDVKLLAEYIQ